MPELTAVVACDKRKAFAQGATGSGECAAHDRLRDEANQLSPAALDCFASLAMTLLKVIAL